MAAKKVGNRNNLLWRLIKLFQHYFPCDRVLAQRIFKSTVNSTVAFIFVLIPQIRNRLGSVPPMLPLISVMVHPGRRVSGTIQGAIYCITGLIFGLAYALLGRFLAQRCLGSSWNKLTDNEHYATHYKSYEAALAILAVFETIMLLFHGWMRSVNHHYFGIVFPLFLVVHFTFLEPLKVTPAQLSKSYTTPFYLGIAMSIFWNLVLFPEFGSSYLGNATVETWNEVHKAVDHAINFFLTINLNGDSSKYTKEPASLGKLLNMKNTIDKKISTSQLVYEECVYEASYSYVSPGQLSPVMDTYDTLSKSIKGIINSCQLEFILLGKEQRDGKTNPLNRNTEKEIEYADAEKLFKILERIRPLVYDLHKTLSESIYTIKLVLAKAYDVNLKNVHTCSMFTNGSFPEYKNKKDFPKDFQFEERIQSLETSLLNFNLGYRNELIRLDINLLDPSDEMFLLSSFLMNFQQVTKNIIEVMKSSKDIYDFRVKQESKGWIRGKTLWINFLRNFDSLKTWITSTYTKGSSVTEDEGLRGTLTSSIANPYPITKRPEAEEDELLAQKIDEVLKPQRSNVQELPISNNDLDMDSLCKKVGQPLYLIPSYYFTAFLVWGNKFYKRSKAHFRFSIQVAIALLLSSFPMFIPKTRDWYNQYRGAWIGFVCILCLEPSVGGTFWVFFLRAVGVIIGSAWAYVSYVSAVNQTNPYLETVITCFGSAPGFYFLLGTPYVKAAIIQIISIYIVILAAVYPGSAPGGILVNFAKRCLAVGYGGVIALLVQLVIFPITAREQLNEEISFVCGCISRMETLYAFGLEGEKVSPIDLNDRYKQFSKISRTAKAALARAEAYKGLTRQEPRLKGKYVELEIIFTQVIFLQKQIIERMDNVALLRLDYGSGVIDELNYAVFPYRRQVVANVSCLMRALQEAFINKTPLPQFLPSARISHRRLVNKVRQALWNKYRTQINSLKPHVVPNRFDHDTESDTDSISDSDDEGIVINSRKPLAAGLELLSPHEQLLKEKFLSWNASSAAIEEIIEYIEELQDLTKILVGVNEFKYGFLSRPLYTDWAAAAVTGFDTFIAGNIPSDNHTPSPPTFSPSEPIQEEIIEENETHDLSSNSFTSGSLSNTDFSDLENQPIAYNKPTADYGDAGPSTVDLARIASHKLTRGKDGLPKPFRQRAFSIGSSSDYSSNLQPLSQRKTLGEADSSFYDTEQSSDDDLPLALKRILSRKSGKSNKDK
ncbi:hypothetical protein Kpol_2000p58 [Vanderwaltozyma polyspora DSM 70294]|uniref:Uncharacterized protein n=1 Tax=Vanderwaltozyma polyspora (strain ATCC 22028 / DSM 70294 / BCRC 21397 / CBS 2163 / NBRC 10782 / NRRL Y-8283 / UCD 57-17) TaxID=436907 RepID=A7TF66_VANPO|nr:uncharacterized protein Kpol_2000p58 [Vanderwaltozyma polyspora DSM 70294]EDO19091.1 hypothetical protein Kpol_2000p58 [Vanderwaltozyma polyspora DSM 70294]